MNLPIPAKDRLIFALDIPNREEAEKNVRSGNNKWLVVAKVGLELVIN